ncbi:Serine/threonine-protein kinase Chk2 [Exophiala dermatitidis]
MIGRDKNRCQYVLNDPYISKRHVRIYTVVYENDEPNEVENLVYAEDLSQNGAFLNGDLIGKGNGGYLLSDGDVLRLSRQVNFTFNVANKKESRVTFDLTQETEMASFRQEYVVTDRLLGAGAFGRVFMAIEQASRAQVACKLVDLRKLRPKPRNVFGRLEHPAPAEDVDSMAQLRKIKTWGNQKKRDQGVFTKLKMYFREINILASLRHPNIIRLEKVYITYDTIYMMQDIVTAGDLFSYIESKNGKLLEAEAAVILRQILVAVRFLHDHNIVHRDIKPDNILMTSLAAGCRVVLTDFGAARRVPAQRHRMSTVIGTREYAAPEMLQVRREQKQSSSRQGYTRAVDMWAVGCVAVILLTGGMAFTDPITCNFSEALARNCNLDFLHKSKDWQAIRQRPKDFVEQLLVVDEESRLTAVDALQHPWFSNEAHKNDFEDLYQRAIKHWRPRPPKSPVIDYQNGYIRCLAESWGFEVGKFRGGEQKPVEPHYIPYPTNVHQALSPMESPENRLSLEVLLAVKKWSPESACKLSSSSNLTKEQRQFFVAADEDEAEGTRDSRSQRLPQKDTPPSVVVLTEKNASLSSGRKTQVGPEEESEEATIAGNIAMHESSNEGLATIAAERSRPSVTPEMVQTSTSMTKPPPSGQERVLSGTGPSSSTPVLKRRISTKLINQRPRKHRGSIFDLAEGGNSDSGNGKSVKHTRPKYLELLGKPHGTAKGPITGLRQPQLYLPR